MNAATGAVDERQDSPSLVEPSGTGRASGTSSREPSPAPSEDLHRAPDAGERPVREQLKNTSINAPETDPGTAQEQKPQDALSEAGSLDTDRSKSSDKEGTISSSRGRPRRKRSLEELGGDLTDGRPATSASKHLRKRSRESDDAEFASEPPHQPALRADSPAKKAKAAVDAQKTEEELHRPTTPPSSLEKPSVLLDDTAMSPQNKRNRDQFVKDHDVNTEKATVGTNASDALSDAEPNSSAAIKSRATVDEPESKRPRDGGAAQSVDKEPASSAKIPASSGFSNSSVKSPFASLGSPKSPSSQPQTSSSAFASSGFASFASSTQSPFGTFGAKPPTENSNEKPEASKSDSASVKGGFGALGGGLQPSPFASAAPSVFGSQSSGFAKLSNGFGSTGGFGSGAPLSSFAKPGSSGIIGASIKPPRPIGASTEEGDDEDEDADSSAEQAPENGEPGPPAAEEDGKDTRFYEQELETGEEDEETIFSNRAKLYVSLEKQWKERGVGTFKINVAYDQTKSRDTAPKKSARFIMRADGSHRVVLNSPIMKQITIEDPTGGPPRGKTAIFLGFIDDKPTMMQLKMRSNIQTEELHSVVTALQETL